MSNGKEIKVSQPKRKKKNPNPIPGNLGQYVNPGKVTEIASSDITMKGVPYPVKGVDNLGNEMMMMPGAEYTFPGSVVTEYPMMKAKAGGWLEKYQTGREKKYTQPINPVTGKPFPPQGIEVSASPLDLIGAGSVVGLLRGAGALTANLVNRAHPADRGWMNRWARWAETDLANTLRKKYEDTRDLYNQGQKTKKTGGLTKAQEGGLPKHQVPPGQVKYVTDPNDPDYIAYQDSAFAYDLGRRRVKDFNAAIQKGKERGTPLKYIGKGIEPGGAPYRGYSGIDMYPIESAMASPTGTVLGPADSDTSLWTMYSRWEKPVREVRLSEPATSPTPILKREDFKLIDMGRSDMKLMTPKGLPQYESQLQQREGVTPQMLSGIEETIWMPSGVQISKKDFIKQYGQGAWDRATNKKQMGGLTKHQVPPGQTKVKPFVTSNLDEYNRRKAAYADSANVHNLQNQYNAEYLSNFNTTAIPNNKGIDLQKILELAKSQATIDNAKRTVNELLSLKFPEPVGSMRVIDPSQKLYQARVSRMEGPRVKPGHAVSNKAANDNNLVDLVVSDDNTDYKKGSKQKVLNPNTIVTSDYVMRPPGTRSTLLDAIGIGSGDPGVITYGYPHKSVVHATIKPSSYLMFHQRVPNSEGSLESAGMFDPSSILYDANQSVNATLPYFAMPVQEVIYEPKPQPSTDSSKPAPMKLMTPKGIMSIDVPDVSPQLITEWNGPTEQAPFVDYEGRRTFTAAGYPMIDTDRTSPTFGKTIRVPKGYIEGSKEEKEYRSKNTKKTGGSNNWLEQYQVPPGQTGSSVPTFADSLALYNNALAKIKFYKNNPDYRRQSTSDTNFKNANVRKQIINQVNRGSQNKVTSGTINEIINSAREQGNPLTPGEIIRLNKTLNEIKFGKVKGTNVYSFGDILMEEPDEYYNPLAPPIYLHPSIAPQGSESYHSDRFVDISDIPYYDPIAIKPASLRTPGEQKEWESKYGNKDKDKDKKPAKSPTPVTPPTSKLKREDFKLIDMGRSDMKPMTPKGVGSIDVGESSPQLITEWNGPTEQAPFVDYEGRRTFTAAGYPMVDTDRSSPTFGKTIRVPKGYIEGSKEEKEYRSKHTKKTGGPHELPAHLPEAYKTGGWLDNYQDGGANTATASTQQQERPVGTTVGSTCGYGHVETTDENGNPVCVSLEEWQRRLQTFNDATQARLEEARKNDPNPSGNPKASWNPAIDGPYPKISGYNEPLESNFSSYCIDCDENDSRSMRQYKRYQKRLQRDQRREMRRFERQNSPGFFEKIKDIDVEAPRLGIGRFFKDAWKGVKDACTPGEDCPSFEEGGQWLEQYQTPPGEFVYKGNNYILKNDESTNYVPKFYAVKYGPGPSLPSYVETAPKFQQELQSFYNNQRFTPQPPKNISTGTQKNENLLDVQKTLNKANASVAARSSTNVAVRNPKAETQAAMAKAQQEEQERRGYITQGISEEEEFAQAQRRATGAVLGLPTPEASDVGYQQAMYIPQAIGTGELVTYGALPALTWFGNTLVGQGLGLYGGVEAVKNAPEHAMEFNKKPFTTIGNLTLDAAMVLGAYHSGIGLFNRGRNAYNALNTRWNRYLFGDDIINTPTINTPTALPGSSNSVMSTEGYVPGSSLRNTTVVGEAAEPIGYNVNFPKTTSPNLSERINLGVNRTRVRKVKAFKEDIIPGTSLKVGRSYLGNLEIPRSIKITGKSGELSVSPMGENTWSLSTRMTSPFEAGKAMKVLNGLFPLPKPSLIETSSLSADSYKGWLNAAKSKDFTYSFNGDYINLNNQHVHSKLLDGLNVKSGNRDIAIFESAKDALKAVNRINKELLGKKGFTEKATTTPLSDGTYTINIPSYKLTRNWKTGGSPKNDIFTKSNKNWLDKYE